jgi:hypothetical protein
VGRGGVEPPTFRFSGVTIPLFAVPVPRWTVVGVCRWLSTVANVAVKRGTVRSKSLQVVG